MVVVDVTGPPFAYYGGKQRLAHRIVSLLPDHEHYVEPFAGSLAVLLAKPPSKMETVNDLDGALMAFWRALRDRPADLERVCRLTPHSRAELQASYDLEADDLERARRVWVQLTQARSGVRTVTGWRYFEDPAGSSIAMPAYLDAYCDRIGPAARRLQSVSLECRPALELLAAYGAHKQACIYADPPYVRTARNSTGYAHEMTDDDHRRLAEALWACRAAVVLSGYASPLYDDLYDGWWRHDIATGTGNGGTWEQRCEVLWSNRPLNTQMALWGAAS